MHTISANTIILKITDIFKLLQETEDSVRSSSNHEIRWLTINATQKVE